MNHIYTTKAIIIKSVPIGEANKYYFLLTQDLGFIMASAQGVRLDKSKLKGHLQDLCIVSISLVKGKEVWRITGVETIESARFLKNTNKLIAIKNIFNLLNRLLHGEEKNEALYNSVESSYNFLINNELPQASIKNLEMITVLRVLYHLGYLKHSSPTRAVGAPTENVGVDLYDFVKDNNFSIDSLLLFESNRNKANVDINTALQETHL